MMIVTVIFSAWCMICLLIIGFIWFTVSCRYLFAIYNGQEEN
jgi:hypothetical protein